MGLMAHSVKIIADGFTVFVGRCCVHSWIANEVVYIHGLQMRYIEVDCGMLLQSTFMGIIRVRCM